MKLKKLPAILTFTFGASTILGFLSFSGMFALWPVLPFAFASMILSVAYEGEIYSQNITSAFQKLFKSQFNERQFAKDFLLKHFPDQTHADRPQFFADYEAQLNLVQKFSSCHLDKQSQILKRKAEKKLSDMEKWFTKELFRPASKPSKHMTVYQTQLRTWFKTIEQQFAKNFLLKHFPDQTHSDRPQFFKDYEAQRNWVEQFSNCHLDKQGQTQKKEEGKKLSDMEKFFAKELFRPDSKPSKKTTSHQAQLQAWLKKTGAKPETYPEQLQEKRAKLRYFKAFSIFAAVFMSLGTSYLLTEAFSVIPFFATLSATTLPFLVFPMALIAGTAYGFLTYNSVTDLFFHKTGNTWYSDLKEDLSNFFQSKQSALKAIGKITLALLALTLTVFTAGTWLTVVQETRPLLSWMRKIPGAVVGASILIVDFLSALAFNVLNSALTLNQLAGKPKAKEDTSPQKPQESLLKRMRNFVRQRLHELSNLSRRLLEQENLGQVFNPFRIVLKLTLTPIRVLLFFGHLVSIGVTADRVPGVSQWFSALLGIISEGFEDAHYFLPHSHHHPKDPTTQDLLEQRFKEDEHQHNHDNDLPTRLIKLLFVPVYLLATGWDYATSQFNASHETRKSLSLNEAFKKQNGIKAEKSISLPAETEQPSSAWETQHALYLIEKQRKRLKACSKDASLASEKRDTLNTLKDELDSPEMNAQNSIPDTISNHLRENPVYNQQRWFTYHATTATTQALENVSDRIAPLPLSQS